MERPVAWLFDTTTFAPHGYCLLWQPGILWLDSIADGLIALAYFSIPLLLLHFARRRRDLAFPSVFLLFGLFIVLCGLTHVMDSVTDWVPAYNLATVIKIATALASVFTACVVWQLMPRALALPTSEQLRQVNAELEREVRERRRVEAELRSLNAGLESRVAQRTGALTRLTQELQVENAQRQRSEQELRQSTETLLALLEAAPTAISVINADRMVVMWNRAAEATFGYSAEEMVGRSYSAGSTGQPDGEVAALAQRVIGGEALHAIPLHRQHRDGRWLDIELSSTPVFGTTGHVHAAINVLEDVTQKHALEAHLRQAQKMEAIGTLTGGMAHDFNNLLSVIIGNLDLARSMSGITCEVDELVGEALDAALRGADLTRRLLAFARRQALQPAAIEINRLVTDLARLLSRTLGEQITLQLDLAPQLWLAVTDPAQLEAAVTNLATNARDAMPLGGKLAITTSNRLLDADYAARQLDVTPGDYVLIEVTDEGSGMAPDVLAHVFEPFFSTKDPGKGTGLGLAMVFGFMKQSGGHVSVYSEVGQGTTFRLYLPRARD
jgi:PAS domain S-box-containing protein